MPRNNGSVLLWPLLSAFLFVIGGPIGGSIGGPIAVASTPALSPAPSRTKASVEEDLRKTSDSLSSQDPKSLGGPLSISSAEVKALFEDPTVEAPPAAQALQRHRENLLKLKTLLEELKTQILQASGISVPRAIVATLTGVFIDQSYELHKGFQNQSFNRIHGALATLDIIRLVTAIVLASAGNETEMDTLNSLLVASLSRIEIQKTLSNQPEDLKNLEALSAELRSFQQDLESLNKESIASMGKGLLVANMLGGFIIKRRFLVHHLLQLATGAALVANYMQFLDEADPVVIVEKLNATIQAIDRQLAPAS